MSYAAKGLHYRVLVVLAVFLVGLAAGEMAQAAKYVDARSSRAIHTRVIQLTKQLSEARHVESATRDYSGQYGRDVGRWVWLARDVGWDWDEFPTLMAVIYRESRGNPLAKNPTSTASGLLQFLAFHWDGTGGYGWSFNPFSPRQNLRYGKKLKDKQGWAPWAATVY